MDVQTKDQRLSSIEQDDDMQTLSYLVAEGSPETASSMALYLIACELRLMRKSLEQVTGCIGHVYDHGPAFSVTQAGR